MGMKMGFTGLAYYGQPGQTAATLIENRTDIKYDIEPQKGNSTVAGDGTEPPPETEEVCTIKYSFELTMKVNDQDPVYEAMMVAAASGSPIALRLKDFSAGKGFDGDVTLGVSHASPINGEQAKTFKGSPSRAFRKPRFYV